MRCSGKDKWDVQGRINGSGKDKWDVQGRINEMFREGWIQNPDYTNTVLSDASDAFQWENSMRKGTKRY